jgi:hypothetical protein
MPGSKVSDATAERIIELRRAGYSCREVARRTGVTVSAVWYRMRASGLNGKIRARLGASEDIPRSMRAAVDRYGPVTIEPGSTGGYIATLDDDITGPERGSIQSAIYGAARVWRDTYEDPDGNEA